MEMLNAKMIIEGLNGSVATKSMAEVGTTIQVSIPRRWIKQ